MQYFTFLTCALATVVVAKKTTTTATPTATSVPSACSATPVASPAKGTTCAISGTLDLPAYFGGAFAEVNRDACAAVCLTIQGCQALQYDEDQNTCQLFNQPLKKMKFKSVKQYTGIGFYEPACFACAPQPTTSSSSSSSMSATMTTAPVTSSSSASTSTLSTSSFSNSTTTATPTTTTSTPTGTLACATASVTVVSGKYNDVYVEYYSGPGFTENQANPGNKTYAPIIYELADTDACSAIVDCANRTDNGPHFYESFDLHYVSTTGIWECIAYYNKNRDATYFNVANSSIAQAYGFSI